MSSGPAVFDTTLQESNEWLKAIEQRLRPCDRQQAYAALRAVLHVLRDRLPMDAVLALSAQLPMLIRGLFLEGWRPQDGAPKFHNLDEMAFAVGDHLPPSFPRESPAAIEAVFEVLADKVDPGETTKLISHLPVSLRAHWPTVYH
jgi:uncharacterized protein (DUF2267 family)